MHKKSSKMTYQENPWIIYTLEADNIGRRFDRWLRQKIPGLTQGVIEQALRKGSIRINNKRVRSGHRLGPEESIWILKTLQKAYQKKNSSPTLTPRLRVLAEKLPACILYEDEDLLILNKLPGFCVQGGTKVLTSIDRALPFAFPKIKDHYIVHRLDQPTSGVLVLARTSLAARGLSEQFREGTTQKKYLALCERGPEQKKGTLHTWLKKVRRGGVERVESFNEAILNARVAKTHYHVLGETEQKSLILLVPETGRMHQLRVHMQSLGTPIVGDRKYGSQTLNNKMASKETQLHLHAWQLAFHHPRTGCEMLVKAPIGDKFKKNLGLGLLSCLNDAKTTD
jgi:23S rRNA pseudouridine955/2504/2580 synthase